MLNNYFNYHIQKGYRLTYLSLAMYSNSGVRTPFEVITDPATIGPIFSLLSSKVLVASDLRISMT